MKLFYYNSSGSCIDTEEYTASGTSENSQWIWTLSEHMQPPPNLFSGFLVVITNIPYVEGTCVIIDADTGAVCDAPAVIDYSITGVDGNGHILRNAAYTPPTQPTPWYNLNPAQGEIEPFLHHTTLIFPLAYLDAGYNMCIAITNTFDAASVSGRCVNLYLYESDGRLWGTCTINLNGGGGVSPMCTFILGDILESMQVQGGQGPFSGTGFLVAHLNIPFAHGFSSFSYGTFVFNAAGAGAKVDNNIYGISEKGVPLRVNEPATDHTSIIVPYISTAGDEWTGVSIINTVQALNAEGNPRDVTAHFYLYDVDGNLEVAPWTATMPKSGATPSSAGLNGTLKLSFVDTETDGIIIISPGIYDLIHISEDFEGWLLIIVDAPGAEAIFGIGDTSNDLGMTRATVDNDIYDVDDGEIQRKNPPPADAGDSWSIPLLTTWDGWTTMAITANTRNKSELPSVNNALFTYEGWTSSGTALDAEDAEVDASGSTVFPGHMQNFWYFQNYQNHLGRARVTTNTANAHGLIFYFSDSETVDWIIVSEAESQSFVNLLTVGGVKVFDPKLEPASGEDDFPIGSPDGIPDCEVEYAAIKGLYAELTVMDGDTEVAAIVTRSICETAEETTVFWDGKWGKKQNGSNTAHIGKFADPKRYAVKLEVFRDETSNDPLLEAHYCIYIVRLGVVEIQFDGAQANERYPLQYHFTEAANAADGISQAGERFPVPAISGDQAGVVWRIGDESGNARNADITTGDQRGNRRDEVAPHTDIVYPPRDTDAPGAPVENDSYNYPVCYKMGSKIRMKIRIGDAGYSRILDRALSAAELNIAQGEFPLNVNIDTEFERESGSQSSGFDAVPGESNKDIAAGQWITFDSQEELDATVGKENIGAVCTFSYTDNGQDVRIPGHYDTSHILYRIADKPEAPWSTTVASKFPWIAAIDYAVAWADGATTEAAVATKITEQINGGAGRELKYDTERGRCNYTTYLEGNVNYRLANLLLLVKNGDAVDDARYWGLVLVDNEINCTDCAATVTTFATVCGAAVKHSEIRNGHKLNEIRAIGHAEWRRPFTSGSFGYHAFATMGAAGSETVYDACLEVGRPDPQIPATRTGGLLPAGMTFDIVPAAGHGAVTAGSNTGNGTLMVTNVYEHRTMNDTILIRCTEVNPVTGAATFSATSVRSGSGGGVVGGTSGNMVTFGLSKEEGWSTIEMRITQGATPFAVNDEFTFDTTFNYDEYRGSLATPEAEVSPGRSAATITKKYTFSFE